MTDPIIPAPKRPSHLPEHAEPCLDALNRRALGRTLSLGGAFGLLCYHDYRPTHDIDAWWEDGATREDRDQVVEVVRAALEPFGEVRVRTWGDVVSIELEQDGKKLFSFQVASRSARLRPSVPSPWEGIPLDDFVDLVANKMVALVERGAPRDFRDIYTLCQTGLATPEMCWRLWRERQERSGADVDPERARLAVATHLERIISYRPLEKIESDQERDEAASARTWYEKELLNALVD